MSASAPSAAAAAASAGEVTVSHTSAPACAQLVDHRRGRRPKVNDTTAGTAPRRSVDLLGEGVVVEARVPRAHPGPLRLGRQPLRVGSDPLGVGGPAGPPTKTLTPKGSSVSPRTRDVGSRDARGADSRRRESPGRRPG